MEGFRIRNQAGYHEHMLRVYSRTELECSRLADGFANVTL